MRQHLTPEQAKAIIMWHPFGLVDTIRPGKKGLFQSVFENVWIIEKLEKFSNRIEIAGPESQRLGYGICVFDEVGPLFIATNPGELAKLNIIDTDVTCNN